MRGGCRINPGEPAGSLLRVGSENRHLVRRARLVRREVIAHGGPGVRFRERTARSLDGFVRQPPRQGTLVAAASVLRVAAGGWAVPGSNGRPPACKARAAAAVCCRLWLRSLGERWRAHSCRVLLRFAASTALPHALPAGRPLTRI